MTNFRSAMFPISYKGPVNNDKELGFWRQVNEKDNNQDQHKESNVEYNILEDDSSDAI